MRYLFEVFGRKVMVIFDYTGGVFKLFSQTFFYIFKPPIKSERTFEQMKKIGVDSLLIVSIVAVFTGIILALQTAYQMQKLSSEIYIANIVALSLVRELGPVLTALIVAGRSGAGITAEIGTMTVTEQVDALYTLASNPVKYLVVPRFLSLAFVLPVLTLYSDLIGVFGGYFIGVYRLGIASNMYITLTFDALAFKDLFTGLLKALFFGMIIAIVGCFEGLKAEGGAEGVGKATTTSVVISFVAIIAADCFFTFLFYVLGQ
ncbi:MAG: ABC transporter permease [Candidatus Omnitrophota bacterium]|nr:ABC transporter permease [Candidatus Omnitrophota bacterium]